MKDGRKAAGGGEVRERIAKRVRGLRGRMSLDTLAGRCGVSRSMISLIERGGASATAVVLDKIAVGLGVTLGGLFDDPRPAAGPVSRGADRLAWRDPESGYVRRNISPVGGWPIQIVEVTLPAGARVAYEPGERVVNVYQQVWVRQGRMELSVGGVVHRLGEDDCLAMRLEGPTVFRNRTRKAAKYIVVAVSERGRR